MAATASAATPAAQEKEPVVDFETTLGTIKMKLYNDTPLHRDNFLKNVREGIYNGVLFHRVIKDFMVQAGDPDSRTADSTAMLGSGDLGYEIDAEIRYPQHYHKYGALAAARTGDNVNPERKSSASQFYIVTGQKADSAMVRQMSLRGVDSQRQAYFRNLCEKHREEIQTLQKAGDKDALEKLRLQLIDETESNVKAPELTAEMLETYATKGGTPHLDGQYTVFGEVVDGMDTVEKIQNVATGRADRPLEDVRILKATIEK